MPWVGAAAKPRLSLARTGILPDSAGQGAPYIRAICAPLTSALPFLRGEACESFWESAPWWLQGSARRPSAFGIAGSAVRPDRTMGHHRYAPGIIATELVSLEGNARAAFVLYWTDVIYRTDTGADRYCPALALLDRRSGKRRMLERGVHLFMQAIGSCAARVVHKLLRSNLPGRGPMQRAWHICYRSRLQGDIPRYIAIFISVRPHPWQSYVQL